MRYSVLSDSIISVRFNDDEVHKTNLPEILTGLTEDRILSFEALQPHQQQPWYSLLVQLAAMATSRENNGDIPTEPDRWRQMLIDLTDGSKCAWNLVVEDVSQPAFMQSPVPEGSLDEAGYKSDITTPDELDMLVTSKNHDVKGNRILRPEPEHWLFALLTLQTMEGFLGRGNYGIVRMNGGFGNRPFVGLAPNLRWGARFKRDLHVLLNNRMDLLDMYDRNGHALLWTIPWDGGKESGIPLADCDPYFMEICRRIRFRQIDKKLCCYRTNTKGSRVSAPDDLNGRTGDPWTPIDKAGVKALTLGESGYTYELLQQLLLGEEYTTPLALKFQEDEEHGAFMVTQALVRGQGKTDGLHRRIVPVPPKVSLKLFGKESEKKDLANRSRQRIKQTEEVQRRILRPAISTLLAGGEDQQIDFDKVASWIDRFDQEIDRRFFESLWESVGMEPDKAKQQWEGILLEEAERQFKEAERSTPIPQLRRLKAVSSARSIFYGRAKEVLEFVGPQTVSVN